MTTTMNSSACHGVTAVFIDHKPNISPMCSGGYTAGKTEQGEINWIRPGDQLEPTVRWMLERTVRDKGPSFPRTGETSPGFRTYLAASRCHVIRSAHRLTRSSCRVGPRCGRNALT
jgi:hypothetical protein